MNSVFIWGSIAVIAIFMLIGFLIGVIRGVKRAGVHIFFVLGAFLIALLTTKPITNAFLGIKLTQNGETKTISEYIMSFIEDQFNLSNLPSLKEFIENLPTAIVAPIVFLMASIIVALLLGIVYLILARVIFGKKREDFENNKPHRMLGGLVGAIEGLVFTIALFAPISSLTVTYANVVEYQSEDAKVTTLSAEESSNTSLKTLSEYLSDVIPQGVDEGIRGFSKSPLAYVSRVGGVNDWMCNYLTSVSVDGDSVSLNKEIKQIATIYDSFVEIYNDYNQNSSENLDLTTFEYHLEDFTDGKFFKKVIANTVKDVVVNYEAVKEDLKLSTSEFVDNLVTELNETFSAKDFDAGNYLKDDVLSAVRVAKIAFNDDLITKYKDLEVKDFDSVINYIDENNEDISKILKKTLTLNVVKDAYDTLGNELSTQLQSYIDKNKKSTEEIVIKINTNVEDKDKMIDDLVEVVNEVVDINKNYISISELMKSDDKVDTINELESEKISTTLDKLGEVFDKARNLDVFVKTEENETTYTVDSVMEAFEFDMLGDEVYLTSESTEKTKISTYSQFFDYLKTPILKAKELNLLDIGGKDYDFDKMIDDLSIKVNEDNDLLVDILMPFYQINALDLKSNVFDTVVKELNSNAKEILELKTTFDEGEDSYNYYKTEFQNLGKLIGFLGINEIEYDVKDDKGNITSLETKTYLRYALENSSDMKTLLNFMNKKTDENNISDLNKLLTNVFEISSCKKLQDKIFDEIDASVGKLTGVTPKTDITNLKDTKESTITTIEKLLSITLDDNTNLTNLATAGQILNLLKENAYNNGGKNGVFNNVFANIIGYMTGDNITSTTGEKFSAPYENSKDVKVYLQEKCKDEKGNFDYYTIDYETTIGGLQAVIDLANKAKETLDNFEFNNISDIPTYITKVKEVLGLDNESTEDDVSATVVEDMAILVNGNSDRQSSILSSDNRTTYGSAIKTEISKDDKFSADMKNALYKLLAIENDETYPIITTTGT